ncbi:MAG: methionyl-tRNA formyltransferase [Actinobacteria bacterium]|nr:methionyl-tRNA formyltransferase [Actinomycetota bacterium]
MRIGVAATPTVALPSLNWLLDSEHELVRTITVPDKPSGRGRVLTPSIVAQWSQEHGIPCLKPSHSDELIGHLEDLDLVITIGYGVILPEKILSLPKHGFINLHFSLLPSYRGAAPVQRALAHGESVSGVTVFALDKGMDTGPIYISLSSPIDPIWRASELLEVLSQMGPKALEDTCELIMRNEPPKIQSGESSLAPKISVEEAQLDFKNSARVISNNVRAFYPSPSAWTLFRGEKMKISRTGNIVTSSDVTSGEIRVDANSITIGCANNECIEILELTPAGKHEMRASDWARGARILPGEIFG